MRCRKIWLIDLKKMVELIVDIRLPQLRLEQNQASPISGGIRPAPAKAAGWKKAAD